MKPKLPSSAMVVSVIALVFAISGLGLAASNVISSNHIKWVRNSVPASALKKGSIVSADLATHAVQQSNLAPKSVGSTNLQDYSITSPKVAPAAITGLNIGPGAVTGQALAPQSVSAPAIKPGAVAQTALSDLVKQQFAPTTSYAASAALPSTNGAVNAVSGISGDYPDASQNTTNTLSDVETITPDYVTRITGASALYTEMPSGEQPPGLAILVINGGQGQPNGQSIAIDIGEQIPAGDLNVSVPANSTVAWKFVETPIPTQTITAAEVATTLSMQQVQ